ncbi:MAG: 50S ribosomal protein L5 [Rickettsiales bacterium]|nr:50S ribosomal protein L5 [Rickettsiales bacterium]
MLGLKDLYKKEVIATLQKEFDFKNIMEVPRIEKVVLSMGVSEAVADSKAIESAAADLALIAGQKALVTKAKKSIATFKLREGMSIGCKVTLRGDMMYAFLEKFVMIALPRVRDFRGLSVKNFDRRGNLNIGIKEHIAFPEIDYDKITKIRGLNVTIVTSSNSDAHAKALLEGLRFPFN